jgi:hypothetical protein
VIRVWIPWVIPDRVSKKKNGQFMDGLCLSCQVCFVKYLVPLSPGADIVELRPLLVVSVIPGVLQTMPCQTGTPHQLKVLV